VIFKRLRLPLLLTAAFALGVPPAAPAVAQSSPGWFVPSQGQPPAAGAAAPAHGRRARTAPAPVASAPLPVETQAPEADQQDQVTDAELQQKAANLPQPPAPPLPDIISSFYSAIGTGDAVKVSASGVGAALPAPLAADTTYYAIRGTGLNTLQLATTADNATAGTAISLENAGAGTLKLTAAKTHTGAANVNSDFSVVMPGTFKLLAGGAAPPVTIVGVLGVPDVMRMSSAAQAVDKVIGARKQDLQAAIQRAQTTWRELENGLRSDAPKLSRDALLSRERALQDRVTADRHNLQEHQRIIQEAAQVALGQIERTLIGIIRQVAESRGMNLVLHRSQVALNVQEFDITDAVAAQLNRALPTVQIPPADVDPATLPKDWGSNLAAK
jgi:autotransporter-associated beta strand protein